MSETATVAKGDRVLVTRLVGRGPIDPPQKYEVFSEGPDSDGDIRVVSNNAGGYLWAHEWAKVETAEPEVEWNPVPTAGETIWVYEYYRDRPITGENGYDVRVTTANYVDSEGDIVLEGEFGKGSYAHKWRRPDPEPETEATPEVEWNPKDLIPGETVWVYIYYGMTGVSTSGEDYDVRESDGHIDSDGDMRLRVKAGFPGLYARKWRRPEVAVPSVDWNPNNLERNTMVWVFEDSNYDRGTPRPDGFAIRSVAHGEIDSDGEIMLNSTDLPGMGGYARKWRLPETNLQPEVNPGDKVKVLGLIDGCADSYRARMMGQVLTVAERENSDNRGLLQGSILVNLPDGYTVDDYTTGAVREWAIIERAENPVTTGISAPVPDDEPDWKAIIEAWRKALNEYACDQEWCEEYEGTVMRLFGWQPERQVTLRVEVKLTRNLWLSDSLDLEKVFGVDPDYVDLDDQMHEVEAQVNVNVTAMRGATPSRDSVKEALEDGDYRYDEFSIIDWQVDDEF